MIAGLGTLRVREMNVAITSVAVGIHNAHLGCGPEIATTFHQDNMTVSVVKRS